MLILLHNNLMKNEKLAASARRRPSLIISYILGAARFPSRKLTLQMFVNKCEKILLFELLINLILQHGYIYITKCFT